MNFEDYQKKSKETAIFPDAEEAYIYTTLGLVGEAGEVAEKVKKYIRDSNIHSPSQMNAEQKRDFALELGDVLWYITQLTTSIGYTLEDIAKLNIEKTHSRRDRGKISGSGDNR